MTSDSAAGVPLSPLALPSPEATQEWIERSTAAELDAARDLVDEIKAASPGRTARQTLSLWNRAETQLANASSRGSLLSEVHPAEAVRSSAEKAMQEVQRLTTGLALDPELFAVFASLDPSGLDASATRVLEHLLRDFRRAGVDRDLATRERLRGLQDRAIEVGQDFSRAIRDGARSVSVRPEQLEGMPEDWLAEHPVDDDGLITVTTDYPDAIPVRTFCRDAAVRRDVLIASLNVGWPENDARLQELFAVRAEIAGLLGYSDWAAYDAEVKMIGRGTAIPEFIDRVAAAAESSARRDYRTLLDRLRQDVPSAEAVTAADLMFYAEALRREEFDVDAREVRRYLTADAVRAGLLEVTGRLFGLHYEPVPDAVTWHEEVVVHDVRRGPDASGELIGRIYLDLHPREGKYKHAAQFSLVNGVEGVQLPEGVLVCNFSRTVMEHDEVVTQFHEFGHLVHHVLGGHQQWTAFSGVATEWDFVEAPSQMLEEWAWDAEVLRSFARDGDGRPIPADLVKRMRRADDFGKGYIARTQMFYAAMSYWFHVERPADLTSRTAELQAAYSMFPYINGTHMPASFGHLEGYGSGYYTYMWSLVIAKDMFGAFDSTDLFAPEVAARYRDNILAPGGSADAADLVERFLGRPYSVDAYERWLAE